MNVRERAFHQVLAWLENERQGDAPQPPEGMHPLAVEEWNRGAVAAQKDFEESDAAWQGVEDLIVFGVKVGILFTIAGVVYAIHEPWCLLAGGMATTALLWRWLK